MLFWSVEGILLNAEFPLNAKQFLSDIVATSLTKYKLEVKNCAESKG